MSTTTLPRPEPCIITALEILGLEDPNLPVGKIRTVLAFIEDALSEAMTTRPDESHFALTTTHVVHVAPIKKGGALPYYSIRNVLVLQAMLTRFGLVSRGCITIGDATAVGSMIFGEGVAQAERLRDEVAVFPRVIVEPRLLREVEGNPDLRPQDRPGTIELGYIRKLLQQDLDGLWFVDYLGAFIPDVQTLLEGHHGLVVRKQGSVVSLDRDAHAVAWLASYHNRSLQELHAASRVDDAARAALIIPATGPLLYSFPPSAKAP